MAITNGYCTVDELKSWLFQEGVLDAQNDAIIEQAIEATSRAIDGYCRRKFWKNSVAEVRYFAASCSDRLVADDIVSLTEVAVDTAGNRSYTTILAAGTGYELDPANAALEGKPYTRLFVAPNSSQVFSTARRGNRLTGIFGWAAVPLVVKEACLIQSMRLFLRKDTPFGVTGSPELGQLTQIVRVDPDVELLLVNGGVVRESWVIGG